MKPSEAWEGQKDILDKIYFDSVNTQDKNVSPSDYGKSK